MEPKTQREKRLVENALRALDEATLHENAMGTSDVIEKGEEGYEENIKGLEDVEAAAEAQGLEMIFTA